MQADFWLNFGSIFLVSLAHCGDGDHAPVQATCVEGEPVVNFIRPQCQVLRFTISPDFFVPGSKTVVYHRSVYGLLWAEVKFGYLARICTDLIFNRNLPCGQC